MTLDLADIQGLFARGYGDLRAAAFLLLGIEDPAAARRWLGDTAGAITSSEARPDERALNLAFTSPGLSRLGLPEAALAMFSNEFVAGMTTPHRSRILGDLDENAPERWEWGSPSGSRIDVALLLYARDAEGLRRFEDEQTRGLAAGGLALRHRLGTSDLDDFEPFGFRDGISQPVVEGLSKTGPPETTVRAGEFVLGYPNEYGQYTGRPLLDAAADPARMLPRDAEGSGRADLGRNGSYLVVRQLRQDVPGFWGYVDRVTRRPDGTSDPQARLRLASKMVGRWPSGAPLTLAPEADDPSLAAANDFGYHELDRAGSPLPGRLAHPPLAPSRLARPPAGVERLLEDQPPPPHPAPRPRVRHVADHRRGARRRRHERARAQLHLPEREHPASVRVRQPHLAEQPEVRRALRRRRSRHRAVRAVRWDVHDAGGRASASA